jgi:hypothetical protein
VNTATIETLRVHPKSLYAPPRFIIAKIDPRYLKLPDATVMKVFSIEPQDSHSTEEANYIARNFPFFHRKILSSGDDINGPTGGYLLSPISSRLGDDWFSSYFSSAEVILTPQTG